MRKSRRAIAATVAATAWFLALPAAAQTQPPAASPSQSQPPSQPKAEGKARAQAPKQEQRQQKPLAEAQALHRQAQELYREGRHAEARAPAERALALREQALPAGDPQIAASLHLLGRIARGERRFAEAERLLLRALALREAALGPDHADTANTLDALSAVYHAQNRFPESEATAVRALKIRETALGPEHPATAESLSDLGRTYRALGRYAESEAMLKRALAIREKAFGTERAAVAQTLSDLARLYRLQGRLREAEPLYRRAIEIDEAALRPDHPRLAEALGGLAFLHVRQNRLGEAEPLMLRALAIREKAENPDRPGFARLLNDLGILYRDQKRYAEAESAVRRGLEIRERIFGPEHVDVAESLATLAALHRSLGRNADAIPLAGRSAAILEKNLGAQHPALAVVLASRAQALRAEGRLEEAYAEVGRAVAILARRAEARGVGEEAGAEAERRSRRGVFVGALAIAAALAEAEPARKDAVAAEAFAVAQQTGRITADQAAIQAAARLSAPVPAIAAAIRLRQDALQRRQALDAALLADLAKPGAERDAAAERARREEIAALDRRIDGIDVGLARDFPQFAELTDPQPAALDAVQKLLHADEAMLYFVVSDEAVYRWTVRRGRADFARIAIARGDLAKLVGYVRFGLNTGRISDAGDLPRFNAARSHELHETLIASAAPMLAGVKHLVVVPDGPLTGIPFAVLVASKPQRAIAGPAEYRAVDWLARRYAVSVLPSVGALRALRALAQKAPPALEPFVGFGDPDLAGQPGERRGAAPAAQALRGQVADVREVRALPPLPETREELARMAELLGAGPAAVHLRAAATERRLKAMDLARYRVIAFATHGLMAGDFAGYAEPALVLTPPEKGDEVDDGLLGASEVAQLKLNADWVVLSACNTAAPDGTPGAEGLSGLARAFFYAGSRSLLVSHWPVASEAAVRLTTRAIDALAKEPAIGRAEALRRSMVALIDDVSAPERFAHPLVWAPFSLVGEGGPAQGR
jgi:CHAT domain-containing protein